MWTFHGALMAERKNELLQDREDKRIHLIQTVPGFAINQTRKLQSCHR